MTLNLSKMKKIAGDKKTSTFQHDDGHQIKILHSALPAIQRKQLEKLPVHLADGGTPNPDISITNSAPTKSIPATMDNSSPVQNGLLQNADNYVASLSNDAGAERLPGQIRSELSSPSDSQTLPEASKDISNAGAPVNSSQSKISNSSATPDLMDAYNQGLKGIKENQDVQSKLSQANSDILTSDVDAKKDLMDGFKQNTDDFQNSQKQFMQDFMNNHVNPNHYQESMSSGQKVGTAIGLLLGGISTPFTHQGNPALDFLNKQIDRDIEAQQSRIGQQKTLLEANQNLYHDQLMATNATRIQLNDITTAKIQQAAANLGTPAAKAAADLAASQFKLQNNNLLQQNALRATVLHSAQANGGQGLDAIDLAHAGLMTAEQAEKEQSSINAQKNAVNAINDIYENLNKEQTTGNLLNIESSRRVGALNSGLVTSIMEASPSKRLTRESIEAEIKPFEINTTDDASVRAAKQQGVLNLIQKHADPTPMMSKYAPRSLPNYGNSPQAPQYKVGQVVNVKGQNMQIINSKGDLAPVK